MDSYSVIHVKAELLQDSEWGEKGAMVDIEVQQANDDDHEYRVFYNGAAMVISKTPARVKFKYLPRAIVIFISAFDVFEEGEMFYETIKADKKTGNPRRSPVSEYYVNLENLKKFEDDSDQRIQKIAALMKIFRDIDHYDNRFPALSERKRILHETEEGVTELSKEFQLFMEKREQAAREEERKEVAASLINEGMTDASFISKICRLFEDSVRKLGNAMGVAVL